MKSDVSRDFSLQGALSVLVAKSKCALGKRRPESQNSTDIKSPTRGYV